jgi:PST family polysaccharide transporter
MMIAAAALGLLGAVALFECRHLIAEAILGEPSRAADVGWLALGVLLMVVAAAQNGILTGRRQIGALARVSIVSALLGSTTGIGALLVWRGDGVLAFVLLSPLSAVVVGAWFLRRAPAPLGQTVARELRAHWGVLLRLGLAFTAGSLAATASQLAVRGMIQRQLGPDNLGHFQAAWSISLNYIAFVLTAMASDYYPRLTAAMQDRSEAVRAINHQAEVALLLAGPLLVGTVALAPWLLELLYSASFVAAVDLLRWQILGDFLKIASWPLGFVLLAGGRGKTFVAVESLGALVLAGVTAFALPRVGLIAPGVAYVAMYLVYLAAVWLLVRRIVGFRLSGDTVQVFLTVGGCLLLTLLLLETSELAGSVAGVGLAGLLAWFALRRLHGALPAPLAAWARRLPGVAGE